MKTRRSPWRRLALFPLLASCCAVAASCSAGLDLQHVRAERLTYNWFAPLTRRYLEADPALDAEAKATHLRGLDAWGARIEAEERRVEGRR